MENTFQFGIHNLLMLFRWDKQVLVGNHIPTIFKCGVQFTSAFVQGVQDGIALF